MRGMIYYTKGNVRIQITTESHIYFYIVDKKTLEAKLENAMINYMKCSQMLFGPRVRSCITYKSGQNGFQIYKRKFFHNFKCTISEEKLENACGANLHEMGAYCLANGTSFSICDGESFSLIQKLNIPITRQDDSILYMTVSNDEKKIALAVGQKLIKDESIVSEILIYAKNRENRFELEKLCDFQYEKDCCMKFKFQKSSSKNLYFFTQNAIKLYDYNDDDMQTKYEF